jgi:hypothetical protein
MHVYSEDRQETLRRVAAFEKSIRGIDVAIVGNAASLKDKGSIIDDHSSIIRINGRNAASRCKHAGRRVNYFYCGYKLPAGQHFIDGVPAIRKPDWLRVAADMYTDPLDNTSGRICMGCTTGILAAFHAVSAGARVHLYGFDAWHTVDVYMGTRGDMTEQTIENEIARLRILVAKYKCTPDDVLSARLF